ncbi:MAG TPA: hypothetical protein PLF81_02045 [Candidatus Anammoximicrobium sp.]|nr:hypothetical protein [Candidatus Anammoximicrobium sp.]
MQDQRTGKTRSEVDMSPEAVDQRLRDVAQLYRLGVALRDAELLGLVEETRRGNDSGENGEPDRLTPLGGPIPGSGGV